VAQGVIAPAGLRLKHFKIDVALRALFAREQTRALNSGHWDNNEEEIGQPIKDSAYSNSGSDGRIAAPP